MKTNTTNNLSSRFSKLGLDRWQLTGIILCIIGVLDASYLTWTKLVDVEPYCAGLGNCSMVLQSDYSVVFGIPISIFGAAGYLTLMALFWFESRVALLREWGATLTFGVALGGAAISAYLVWLQATVIEQYCLYCLVSATLMTLIFITATIHLYHALNRDLD